MTRSALLAGLLAVAVLGTSCPGGGPAWSTDAGDATFAQQASLLVWGRRPLSFGEGDVLGRVAASQGRGDLVRAMARADEYVDHWVPVIYDVLRISRMGPRAEPACTDERLLDSDGPELAEFVRDEPPDGAAFGAEWTLLDLTRSSLRLDDMRPLLRANLMPLVGIGHEPPNLLEAWGQRSNRLEAFADVYLGRTLPCLPCHNSEFSVTGHADPARDRTWEIPGHFEAAVFGDSGGREEREVSVLFRRLGVVHGVVFTDEEEHDPPEADQVQPWGLAPVCGRFRAPDEVVPDVSGIEGFLGAPTGGRGSVYEVELILRTGMERLADAGLEIGSDDSVSSPQALAWLTASEFVETVWEQTMGHPLTLSHGFPRNEAQRDLLWSLTETFVASDWSLVELLAAIAETPYLNQAPPASTDDAYPMPAVFDPFSSSADDEAARGNGSGDALHPRSSRVLVRSAHRAMEWPVPSSFPIGFDQHGGVRDVGLGSFLREGEGEGGIGLESMLRWEELRAACRDPDDRPWGPCDPLLGCEWVPRPRDWEFAPDFIDALVAQSPEESLRAGAEVLAERLVGDHRLDGLEAELEALMEADLDAPLGALDRPDRPLRRLCGALLSTPQFLLGGAPPDDPPTSGAALVLPGQSFEDHCARLSDELFDGGLDCEGGLAP